MAHTAVQLQMILAIEGTNPNFQAFQHQLNLRRQSLTRPLGERPRLKSNFLKEVSQTILYSSGLKKKLEELLDKANRILLLKSTRNQKPRPLCKL